MKDFVERYGDTDFQIFTARSGFAFYGLRAQDHPNS
jgi:hypothetical protein